VLDALFVDDAPIWVYSPTLAPLGRNWQRNAVIELTSAQARAFYYWSVAMKSKICGSALLTILGITVLPGASVAAPIVGQGVYVDTTGSVKAEFLGSDAGYDSVLNLESPVSIPNIFHNHTTPVGTMVDLGVFTAGTELVFSIDVLTTGNKFYTGLASRNADGIAHNVLDSMAIPGASYVGFEDLHLSEMPDLDYNDLNFSFTNTVIPEPSTLGLAAMALAGGLALLRRRLRAMRA
jgi:hypothetical protein